MKKSSQKKNLTEKKRKVSFLAPPRFPASSSTTRLSIDFWRPCNVGGIQCLISEINDRRNNFKNFELIFSFQRLLFPSDEVKMRWLRKSSDAPQLIGLLPLRDDDSLSISNININLVEHSHEIQPTSLIIDSRNHTPNHSTRRTRGSKEGEFC